MEESPPLANVNPFENYVQLSTRQKIMVLLMTVTIFPIRLLCVCFLLSLTVVIALAAYYLAAPRDLDAPRTKMERLALLLCCNVILLCFRLCGFSFRVDGSPAPGILAPVLVMAPHTSFWDVLPCAVIRPTPSVVAKSEALRTPVLSAWLLLIRYIAVARDDENRRRDAREQLIKRAKLLRTSAVDHTWPQVLIFPEATCHNRKSLLHFYSGAFAPGLPIQPICVHWPKTQPDCVSYVFDGSPGWMLFWLQLCQWSHPPVRIEFLPVYTPNEEEKADASLYASNVRRVMASALSVPLSHFSYHDAPYVCKRGGRRPDLNGHVYRLMDGVSDPYTKSCDNNNLESIVELSAMKEFSAPNFMLDREEFAQFITVRDKNAVESINRRLFNVFDAGCKGRIDVREYLLTRYGRGPPEKYFRDAFTALMHNTGRQSISMHEASIIIRLPCRLGVQQTEDLCAQMDGGKGEVTL